MNIVLPRVALFVLSILSFCTMIFAAEEAERERVEAASLDQFDVRNVEGWSIYVRKQSFVEHEEEMAEVMDHLQSQLYQVRLAMPAAPVAIMQERVPIWIEYDAGLGTAFHPSVNWVLDRGHRTPSGLRSTVGLSTAMGGWFGRHMRNMQAAGKMVAWGVVVGTQANGRVLGWSPTRMPFRYAPVAADLGKMMRGLDTLIRVLLKAGARRVILNAWDDIVFSRERDLAQLPRVVNDPRFLTVASSHPQGGNALGRVLDEQFRVKGYENLHVADASVFPGSVQVNPQMTVMAMARYAGERME